MGFDTPCHVWNGRMERGRSGRYGTVYHAGKYRRAHRVTWEIANGPIKPGYHLHHLCGVTRCVNPAHLIPMTASEHVRMERAKLTPALVRYIRESSGTIDDVADELHVSRSLVSQVRTRAVWADIE